jgi:hypothetical protein
MEKCVNDELQEALESCEIPSKSLKRMRSSSTVLTTLIPGGESAVQTWEHLRDRHARTGYWPVLRGEQKEDEDDDEVLPMDILARVPSGNVIELMSRYHEAGRQAMLKWFRENGQAVPPFLESPAVGESAHVWREQADEPWPASPSRNLFQPAVVRDTLSQEPLEKCELALVPTKAPADCPAYLGFGGWNACPSPEYHVAVMRNWERRFGAVPAVISNDTIELFVSRPPETEEETLGLAAEQYAYCDDIVGQGTQTVRRLAMEIWQSPQWYFWWD